MRFKHLSRPAAVHAFPSGGRLMNYSPGESAEPLFGQVEKYLKYAQLHLKSTTFTNHQWRADTSAPKVPQYRQYSLRFDRLALYFLCAKASSQEGPGFGPSCTNFGR